MTERPPPVDPEADEEATKKLLKAEPRESTEAAEQEVAYPEDETNEG